MGLDNGICVKKTEYTKRLGLFEDKYPEYPDLDYEICYWRKCWNVRNMIYSVIKELPENNSQLELSAEDLINIRNGLKEYNKKNWSERESIWIWKEIKPNIKKHIADLKILIRAKQIYGDQIEIYFYDSY